jgi:lysophospholipase L1-like esterase
MGRGVALVLGSLLLTALLLEGGARLVLRVMGDSAAPIRVGWERAEGKATRVRDLVYVPDPELFFRLAPNLDVGETSNPRIFDLRTDSRGLRSREPLLPRPAGTFRILTVGDSCTFGSGAGQSGTYPAQLERHLTTARAEPRFEVLNAGVPGFTSYQALRFLETEGFSLGPDAVVFATGINDASPATAGSKRRFGEGRMLSDREYAEALRSNRRLGITRLLWRAGLGLAGGGGAADEPDGVKRRVAPGEYAANLESFVEASRARGALPVIVVWPLQSQAAGSAAGGPAAARNRLEAVLALYQEAAIEVARRTGAPLVNLLDGLRGREDLFIDAVHLGAPGYGVVADRVADAILAELPDRSGREAPAEARIPLSFQSDGTFWSLLEESASPGSRPRALPWYRQQHPLPKRAGPLPSQGAARSRCCARARSGPGREVRA